MGPQVSPRARIALGDMRTSPSTTDSPRLPALPHAVPKTTSYVAGENPVATIGLVRGFQLLQSGATVSPASTSRR